METAVAVPLYIITSEIRNSYICSTSGVDLTILVLHLAAYGQFLSARLMVPSTTKVCTILEKVWQHWSGPPIEDQLPLPTGMPFSVFREVPVVGRRCLRRCRMKNKDPTIRFDEPGYRLSLAT